MAQSAPYVTDLTSANFDENLEKNEWMVVEFYTTWCPHCKDFKPKYEAAASEMHTKGDKAVFGRVDITSANKDIQARYGVRAIPTTFLVHKKEQVAHMAGGRDTATLEQWVDYYENKGDSLPDELNMTMALPEEPGMPNMTNMDDKIGEIFQNFQNIAGLIFHPFKLITFIFSMFAQNMFHMAGDHQKAQYVPTLTKDIKPVETKPLFTLFFDKLFHIEQKIGAIIDIIFHPYKLVFMIITWIFQRITKGLEHVTDYMVPVKLF